MVAPAIANPGFEDAAPERVRESALVWAPDLESLVDHVSTRAGTGIGATYDAGTGTLDLSGSATSGGTWVDPQDITDAALSFSLWVRLDSVAANEVMFTLGSSSGDSVFIRFDASSRVQFIHIRDGGGTHRNRLGSDAIPLETWVNITVTADETDLASGVLIYVDGVETGSYAISIDGSGGTERPFDGSFLLGNSTAGSQALDGQVRAPRVWSRALTAAEVLANYQDEANTDAGRPAGWRVASSAAVYEWAGFDEDTEGAETYQDGWGVTTFATFSEDQLEAAEFNGDLSFEGYEALWGPMDGTDSNYPNLVSGSLGENSGFQETLTLTEAAAFGGDNFESYETGWGSDGVALELTSTEAATFDVADDTAEDYEEEWLGNEDFITAFMGVGDDLEASSFAGEDFESYETVIDAVEVLQVTRVAAGTFTITLNGTPFSYPASGAESEAGLAGLLSGQINAGSFPFESEVINTDQIAIRVTNPGVELLLSVEVPTGGELVNLTPTLRLTSWMQTLLG